MLVPSSFDQYANIASEAAKRVGSQFIVLTTDVINGIGTKLEKVVNPVAGQFELISTSYLKVLAKGIPDAGAVEPNRGVPPEGGAGDQKAGRDGWVPIGDAANGVMVNAPAPPPVAPKGPLEVIQLAPRTEFVIVFIWREPIAGAQTIELFDKK